MYIILMDIMHFTDLKADCLRLAPYRLKREHKINTGIWILSIKLILNCQGRIYKHLLILQQSALVSILRILRIGTLE